VPFHATAKQVDVNTAFPDDDPVHVIPSDEYPRRLSPAPPPTQRVPFHATAFIPPLNIPSPEVEAVHVIPSDE
jgi:hypothetical protein